MSRAMTWVSVALAGLVGRAEAGAVVQEATPTGQYPAGSLFGLGQVTAPLTPPTATLHARASAACSVIVEAYGPGMRVTYNKLIRDRIPEVIQANGRHAVTQADGYVALHARQGEDEVLATGDYSS
jgi:hypothetical protein